MATQLQFIFTRTANVTERFPNRAKVQYRAFSSDVVKEILFGDGEVSIELFNNVVVQLLSINIAGIRMWY